MYRIIKNNLAPKCTEKDGIDIETKSHLFLWNKCNFRCGFCRQAADDFKITEKYFDLSDDEFIATIIHLCQHGKNFKFSGGEPTLNPRIEWELGIVKSLGGTVFFDTNGSNPEKVKILLDKKLIDVLAVSLKGLSKEETLKTTEIKKSNMCWENVFKTIEYGANTANVKVIITHVCYNDASMKELEKFSELIKPYPNVFYKINNLHKNKHRIEGLKKVDTQKLYKLLEEFIENNPCWKGRVIFVDSDEGITNYEKIVFM